MTHAARALFLLLAIALAAPLAAKAGPSRPLEEGLIYLGTAPGLNFGGHSLKQTLYIDMLQAGYILSSGVDLSVALSGANIFPDRDEFSLLQTRFQFAYRPFLRDPLPVIQPYPLVGAGFGGIGNYDCAKENGREICERAHWGASFFLGGGIDLNAFLTDVAGQQLLVYGGVQARYEWIRDYRMTVITFPVGLRLQ